MTSALQEKHSISSIPLLQKTTENSRLVRSILLSVLLVSLLSSAAVFAAKFMGSLHISNTDASTLSSIGASICFTSLPFLIAIYRRHERAAVMMGSVVLFLMVILAGVVS
ncbi:MAG: hypothetical protein K2Y39_27600 [Candidatus Obscuribacterales bacterium]|nr:hypothetical protein [Candidatus Obscuribacterales bacterium]